MKGTVKKILSLSLLFFLSFQSVATGQTYRGSIRGTISDVSQTRIPGAIVKLVETETNEIRTTTSSDDGEFIVSLLPPGSYRLEVEQAKYKKYTEQLVLQVNQELRINVTLDVGSIAEEVIVTSPQTP